jgi:integrase
MLTGELKPFHVMEWVESKTTWGANQRRGAIIAVSRPFNWAAKIGYIESNPVRGVEKPTPEKRDSRMTPADFATLLSHVKDDPFRELLTFAYEAGCRPQEARLIEARHLKLAQHRVEIPPKEAKGKKRWRVIYLSDKAVEIVSRLAQLRPTGPLCLNVDKNPWKAQAIVCRFQRLLVKLAGLHVSIPPLPRFDRRKFKDPTLLAAARKEQRAAIVAQRKKRAKLARESETRFAMYDLRHCFATRKLKEGHDPITVAALLGHKDASMLCKHYEEISRDGDHLRQAVR